MLHDNVTGPAHAEPQYAEENNYANHCQTKPSIPSLKKKPAPLPPLLTPPTPPKKAPLKLPIQD